MTAGEHPLEKLGARSIGALDAPECAAVEQHLDECPECQDLYDEYCEVASQLTQREMSLPAPPGLWENISEALPRRQPIRFEPRKRGTFRLIVLGWAATAAALLVLGGLFAWQQFSNDGRSVAQLASAEGPTVPLASNNPASAGTTGRLYFSEDGTQGGLAVTGLQPQATFDIWFIKPDQTRMSGGSFVTDSKGQALVKVKIPGPLTSFDGVGITERGENAPKGPVLSGPLYE